jgi:hypothetical protein
VSRHRLRHRDVHAASITGAFDVNLVGAEGLAEQHGWTALAAWKTAMPAMLAEQIRGATGQWWVRAAMEVRE